MAAEEAPLLPVLGRHYLDTPSQEAWEGPPALRRRGWSVALPGLPAFRTTYSLAWEVEQLFPGELSFLGVEEEGAGFLPCS